MVHVTVAGSSLKDDPVNIFKKAYAGEAGVSYNGNILDLNRSNSHKVN